MPLQAVLSILILLTSAVVQAETVTVSSGPNRTPVLELYTSEGCSSCPPADRWLAQLIGATDTGIDVLALAFHVDYWDYIGWKDEFADARYTDRQRRLARHNSQRTIYTPEFFVDGIEARGTGQVLQKIRQANRTPAPVSLGLTVHKSSNTVDLQLEIRPPNETPLQVQFVAFEDNLANPVARGENAGRLLSHQRVVRYLSHAVQLPSSLRHQISLDPEWKAPDLGFAAVVFAANGAYLQSVFTPPGK